MWALKESKEDNLLSFWIIKPYLEDGFWKGGCCLGYLNLGNDFPDKQVGVPFEIADIQTILAYDNKLSEIEQEATDRGREYGYSTGFKDGYDEGFEDGLNKNKE